MIARPYQRSIGTRCGPVNASAGFQLRTSARWSWEQKSLSTGSGVTGVVSSMKASRPDRARVLALRRRRTCRRDSAQRSERRSRVPGGLAPQAPNLAEYRRRGPRVGALPTVATTKAVAGRDRDSGLLWTSFFSPPRKDNHVERDPGGPPFFDDDGLRPYPRSRSHT